MRVAWCIAVALAACGGPDTEPDAGQADGWDDGGADDAGSEDAATDKVGSDARTGVELVAGSATRDATTFVDVEDGADVELVPGAQGGFHVWTGLRIRGAAGRLRVTREARRASDGELVLLAPTLVMEVPDAALGEWWERPAGEPDALPSFMCPTPIGLRVRDEPLTLRTELRDDDENFLADDTIRVTPRCPEDDPDIAEFCAEICSG